jgi:uncharacterized SAM-binding protein YcdF (DUF218 family)
LNVKSPHLDRDLTEIGGFLARRDVENLSLACLGQPVDLVVVAGCAVLAAADAAAKALLTGAAKRILASGGIGHSTTYLREAVRLAPDLQSVELEERSEAEILRDVIHFRHGIPFDEILAEAVSTNCGGNANETKKLLESLGLVPSSVILIQDPTMQRRTHASFERAWRGEQAPRFISFAPFVPIVTDSAIYPSGIWFFERFLSLVIGEIPRLMDAPGGYGPRGSDFIEHVDIPDTVIKAHARIVMGAGIQNRS